MKGPKPLPFSVLVWRRVLKTGTCWLWQGATTKGYGNIRRRRTNIAVHRWAYEDAKGPIPPGMDLDHLCRVRNCVNPDHLEPVRRGVNVLRGATVAAENGYKTHCIRGHAFDVKNTRVNIDQFVHRSCKQCAADRKAARRAAGICSRCPNPVAAPRSLTMCIVCADKGKRTAREWWAMNKEAANARRATSLDAERS